MAFQLLCKGYQVVGTVSVVVKKSVGDSMKEQEKDPSILRKTQAISSLMPYLSYWKELFPEPQLKIVELNAPLHVVDPSILRQVCEGAFCVYHSTTIPSVTPTIQQEPQTEEQAEEMFYKPAVEGTKKVLEVCEGCGVNRVIITSGVATVFNPYNPPR